MTQERRNDVGHKVTITVLSSVLALVLSLFVHAVWGSSTEARKIGERNTKEISDMRIEQAYIRACFDAVRSDIEEIKTLLKRRIPNG